MTIIKDKKPTNIVQSMVNEQYKEIASSAFKFKDLPFIPNEGWVRTIRKALGMSGAQLAQRLNLSRNRVSILERREIDGDITINQLKKLAAELDCELTYGLVPNRDIDALLEERAEQVAKEQLSLNAQNMFLEAQSIDSAKEKFLFEQLKKELLNTGGRVLWNSNKKV